MRILSLIVAGISLVLSISTAHAAGGGGGSSGGGGGGGDDERIVNDADYRAAMIAVKASDWSQVIVRMNAYVARAPGDADAWNELGHAYRKTGDLNNAFKDYDKALQIDPKHRNAHEYLGEAYLQAGDLGRAEVELRALDSLCFLPCEQFSDLKEQVRLYKIAHPPVATR
ncbi:MAG: tetratricopeptide repeat protein [Caldimonas sp.]